MTQPFRLQVGGAIDRTRLLNFRFDGRGYEGHPGDTLASALLANGVRLVARSFKYHRPRGIISAGPEEPSALVQLETGGHTEPNRRPTEIALYDGLRAASQHAWPSLARRSWGGWLAGFAPLLPAGFYYKTFMQPPALWRALWEPALRHLAGLGQAPALPDPSRYDKCHAHCDVLVVGGGPSGLAAALAAGRSGARVILADSDTAFGGALLQRPCRIGHGDGAAWASASVAELASLPRNAAAARHHGRRPVRRQLPRRGRAGRRVARAHRARRAAAPAPVAHPRPPRRAGDRRLGAASRLRRQRPPGHHAGERRRNLSAPLCRDAGPARGAVRQQRRRLSARCRAGRRRCGGCRNRRPAPGGRGDGAPAGRRHPGLFRARGCRDRRPRRVAPGAAAAAGRASRHFDRLRLARRLGRLEPDIAPLRAGAGPAALR